jgi:hypothetical protein
MGGPPDGDWSVSVGPEMSSLLAEVLNCHQIFRWLTKPQRAALLDEKCGDIVSAHPVVIKHLQKRGLIDDDQRLTEVGSLVRKWNKPIPKEPSDG